MSKLTGLAAIMASLFPKSNQPLSEKLSTEEYNALANEAADLQAATEQLEAANLKVTEAEKQLAAATLKVTEAETKLSAADKQVTELEGKLTSLTTDHDKYKAHYDKAAAAGKTEGNADANSLNGEVASYNQHAIEVFHELHGK